MTCQELVELVTDYLEGALPEEDRERFEDHLAGCRHCATHIAQMRTTIAVVGRLREEELPDVAREELLATFRDWKSCG